MPLEGGHGEWLICLRQCQNDAASAGENDACLTRRLSDLSERLSVHIFPEKLKQNLTNLLEYLLCETDLNWITCQLAESNTSAKSALSDLFMKSPADCCLLALSSSFDIQSTGARQALCLHLLETFFKTGRFASLLLNEASTTLPSTSYTQIVLPKLITVLTSLPDKVANNTMGKFSGIFHHKKFFHLLAIQTQGALEQLVANVRAEKSVSTQFFAQILGQFCLSGKADDFLGVLLPFLVATMKDDFIWRRLFNKILCSIPERCLEPVITYIVNNLEWHGCMRWMLGDAILTNHKLKFLLLHKLILVRHFREATALKNIIGYVSGDEKTEHLLLQTLTKLLSVWADASAIKHVSYEQHKYVTQAILICIGHLTKRQCADHCQELTLALMPGMSTHLDCSDASVRRLGMIVGEALTAKVDTKSKDKLKFEYAKDEESTSLTELVRPQAELKEDYFRSLLEYYNKTKEEILKILEEDGAVNGAVRTFTTSKSTFLKVDLANVGALNGHGENVVAKKDSDNGGENRETQNTEFDSDDDDDDDLEPYDLSNDTVQTKVRKPMYIRDCMEGLLQTDNREKLEVSLSSAKKLIEDDPVAAKEISVELCRILLTIEDTFALPNFTIQRHGSMVALAVVDPKNVAEFLTTEFYRENYSLQHRLDMLDVLTASAGVLSSVQRLESTPVRSESLVGDNALQTTESWREIVDKRIESKTRRFGKPKKKTFSPPKANEFGPVAGYFFYPLLAGFDKRIRTLDLLGTDSLVLGRLLYSVGTVVYSAMNTMAANAMAKSLLEFVLEFRYHSEAFVRQAALFCVSMAAISSGGRLSESGLVGEVQDWVTDLMSHDPSTRTKELAAQTAVVLNTSFSKQLGSDV